MKDIILSKLPQQDIGDFLDRLSIVRLKRERIGAEVNSEFDFYESILASIYVELGTVERAWLETRLEELRQYNSEIWDAEGAIRAGQLDGCTDYKALWERTITVRDSNRSRNQVKNKIKSFFNTGFPEVRINCVSNPN